AEISRAPPGSSQCLLEYLLNRLRSGSPPVKLKVLKILRHTCAPPPPRFALQLKSNACFIREAAPPGLGGLGREEQGLESPAWPPPRAPGQALFPHPSLSRQDLASVLFSDVPLPQPAVPPAQPLPPAGMGSGPPPCGSLQGFGFSSERSGAASTGEALLSTIQRAAAPPAHAVLPSPGEPQPHRGEPPPDSYEPVRAPSPARSPSGTPPPPVATTARNTRVSHQPGLAGGGWEEADSGHSSRDSSQGNSELSRTSDSCSKSGSDSHSRASRELSQAAESRVDADSPGDCVREVSLVSALTRGARAPPTREEAQHFVKECGLLNCAPPLELLSRALRDPSDSVRMAPPHRGRSMCAVSSLMCSDLLPPHQIFAATRQPLRQLSQGSPPPVANRATKILRQFEALCRAQPPPKHPDSDPSALTAGSAPCPPHLLTDVPPLASESILTPLPPPPPPARSEEHRGTEAETHPPPGAAVPACPCEQEVASRLPPHTSGTPTSLFAGMELVPRPPPVLCADLPPVEPRTLSQDPPREAGGSRQPSAFAFLNV
ncbi:AP4AT protein, partial [Trogon melanurus]|nr:AP4AT protein [Trogon melanurus]